MNSKIKESRNKTTVHQSYSFKKQKPFAITTWFSLQKINYLAGKKMFILN